MKQRNLICETKFNLWFSVILNYLGVSVIGQLGDWSVFIFCTFRKLCTLFVI